MNFQGVVHDTGENQLQSGWEVSYAINQFEMWQKETFNEPVLDKEFGICQELGFNLVRIYLHEDLWFQDAKGFKKRISRVLELASAHGIKVTFTFCTNGGGPEKLGPQPDAIPGVHGGGHWCQSPKKEIFFNEDRWPEFKEYLQDILRTFGRDSRILYWCLYNEPENVRNGRDCLKFMKARKPYIHTTLENTTDENAVSSRMYLQEIYDGL